MAAPLLLPLFLLPLFFIPSLSHNITAILTPLSEYSLYNSYLSQTKLADDINSRQTITCLVLQNGAMSALTADHPLSAVKNSLALLTLLDYYDAQKLRHISKGSTISTTLFQTTGEAYGNLGFVNITHLEGGKVAFASAAPVSKFASTYTKSIRQIPYNISVLEIDAPIIAPGLLSAAAPTASNVNITALLDNAGCKTFTELIITSGVVKSFQSAMGSGLTVFVPSDKAFEAPGLPNFRNLSAAELNALLQYHAAAVYAPIGSLKTATAPISTMASTGARTYDLTVSSTGDSVTLSSGVDSSRIASTVIDSTPICIFTIDSVLLPRELFGSSLSPSPMPAPELVVVASPSPAPKTSSPSSSTISEITPPTPSAAGSPAEAPVASADDNKSIAVNLEAPKLQVIIFMIFAAFAATFQH